MPTFSCNGLASARLGLDEGFSKSQCMKKSRLKSYKEDVEDRVRVTVVLNRMGTVNENGQWALYQSKLQINS